jgi:hypothetical protein
MIAGRINQVTNMKAKSLHISATPTQKMRRNSPMIFNHEQVTTVTTKPVLPSPMDFPNTTKGNAGLKDLS